MKKTIIALLCISLMLPLTAMTQYAEGILPHIDFVDSGSCGDGLFFELDRETGVLTVTMDGGDGKMYFPEDGSCTIHIWHPNYVKKMILPDGLKTLLILDGSIQLSELDIPSSVEDIVFDYSYTGRSDGGDFDIPLKKLFIPENVRMISGAFLACCNELESFEIDENNRYLTYDGHTLYGNGMSRLIFVFDDPAVFVVPDAVTELDTAAFRRATSLRSLTLSEGIKTVYDFQFETNGKLEYLNLKGAERIEFFAFAGCTSLKYVDLPVNLKSLCLEMFNGLKVRSLYIPRSLESFNYFQYSYFQTISDIFYPGTEEEWDRVKKYGSIPKEAKDMKFHFGWTLRDVYMGTWYGEGVVKCVESGLMTGVSEESFAPDMTLTRAMFVQILARSAIGDELDGYTYNGKFTDVKEESWYAKAVQWAVDNGVTEGTGETTFSPDEPVTREQLAVFFMAYARSKGCDTSASVGLDKYTDAGQISSWAVNAIKWAVAEGLITGTGKTTVSPKMCATRAQTAVIINSFLENIIK
ncbi:MAG: S-layer homology domain-containing protein [Clostridia bacterium]|nr:S-layer homology domain-containing protein [Clostridia bacterium]